MDIAQYLAAAQYPKEWLECDLATGAFIEQQAQLFLEEYGNETPRGGTEHWRYGTFNYWLRQPLDRDRIEQLLAAAIADPDPPMAGNVLKAILSNEHASADDLNMAVRAVAGQPDYYLTEHDLELAFRSSRGNGAGAA